MTIIQMSMENERLYAKTESASPVETAGLLRSLMIKMWLISQHRIDDLQAYDAGDLHFEQEAEQAEYSVEIVERGE